MRRCLFVFIFFFSLVSQAEIFGKYLTLLEEVNYNGQKYYLLTVEGMSEAHPFLLDRLGSESWVEAMLERTWTWILDEYVSQNRFSRDSHVYKELSTKESFIDQRSVVQILFKGPLLTDIIAVMRVARQGRNSEKFVSLEKRRNKKLSPILDSHFFVEWKNFIKKPDVPTELTSLLLREALRKQMFDFTMYGKPNHYVVGETYAGKIQYFMKEYGFELLDYDPAPDEAWTGEDVLKRLKTEGIESPFFTQLKGIFIIAEDKMLFKSKVMAKLVERARRTKNRLPLLKVVKFTPLSPRFKIAACGAALGGHPLITINPVQ